jgi:hypothetical protein
MSPTPDDARVGRQFAIGVMLLFLAIMGLHALSEADAESATGYGIAVSAGR